MIKDRGSSSFPCVDFSTCNYYIIFYLLTTFFLFSGDLWALGCIVYQMLIGFPPFYGSHEFEIFQKIRKYQIYFPNELAEPFKNLIFSLLVTLSTFSYLYGNTNSIKLDCQSKDKNCYFWIERKSIVFKYQLGITERPTFAWNWIHWQRIHISSCKKKSNETSIFSADSNLLCLCLWPLIHPFIF